MDKLMGEHNRQHTLIIQQGRRQVYRVLVRAVLDITTMRQMSKGGDTRQEIWSKELVLDRQTPVVTKVIVSGA